VLIENSLNEATGVQTVIQGVYPRPGDPFPTAAWNSALTTGALAPMDRKRFAKLTNIYAGVQHFADTQERENRAAVTLSALALPQEFAPATRTTMLGALYEVDTSRFLFAYGGPRFAEAMKELGWNDKAEIDRWIAEERAEDIKSGAKWRSCIKPQQNPFDQ
jgi:hypothetical protein